MKRTPTITAFPPVSEDDPTTVLSTPKTIPFGSTLSPKPLRVWLTGEYIRATYANGISVDLSRLPKWEWHELVRHLQFACETGVLNSQGYLNGFTSPG